jgi:transcriptional regulator with XRE-family HTH domain
MAQVRERADIRDLRRWYGLSQPEFARAAGVSERAVIPWELVQVTPMPLARRSLALLDDLRTRLLKRYGEKRAKQWLRQPNRALRGNPPIDVLIASGPTPVRDIVVGPEAGTYR